MTEQHGSDQSDPREGRGMPPRPGHEPGGARPAEENATTPIPRPDDTQAWDRQPDAHEQGAATNSYGSPEGYGQHHAQAGDPSHEQAAHGEASYGQPSYGQPSYGQPSYGHSGYDQGQYDQDQYGQGQYGQQTGYGQQDAWHQPAAGTATATRPRRRGRFGAGTLVACTLIAGLLGGGAAVGVTALADGGAAAGTTSSSQSGTNTVIVNNQQKVNAISAAAQKASPSVATIAVSGSGGSGTGSGIILDTDGHILTNTHVVTLDGQVSKPTIQVQLNDGRIFSGSVVGTDPLSDLAVIKISASNLTPADIGSSGSLNVGDTAIAIGSPLGLANTVTDGIVSTLNRTIQVQSSAVPKSNGDDSGDSNNDQSPFNFAPPGGGQSQQSSSSGYVYLNVIQTDAAINPGNSGGALVDQDGKIIGVNVAIASSGSSSSSTSSGNIGVGFSIPIDHAKRVADELIKDGSATHGQLGASVQSYAPGSSDSSSAAFSNGARIASVVSGSAAAKAGLKEGDVITKVGDRSIRDSQELTAAVREQAAGAKVTVQFTRNNSSQSVDVTLGEATVE